MKGNLFMLGWRTPGSPRRRWQVQYCVDMAEAERIAAGLVKFDGGGRWRVYGFTRVQLPNGPVRLDRGDLLAEGIARRGMRQAEGIHRQRATTEHRSGDGSSGCADVSGRKQMEADPLRGRAAGGGDHRPGGGGRAITAHRRGEHR